MGSDRAATTEDVVDVGKELPPQSKLIVATIKGRIWRSPLINGILRSDESRISVEVDVIYAPPGRPSIVGGTFRPSKIDHENIPKDFEGEYNLEVKSEEEEAGE